MNSFNSEETHIIVDKYKTHSYKSRTGHYLVLVIDGKEYNLHVNRLIYSKYNIGEEVILKKYNGALGYSYYEYCLNEIYIYDEKKYTPSKEELNLFIQKISEYNLYVDNIFDIKIKQVK